MLEIFLVDTPQWQNVARQELGRGTRVVAAGNKEQALEVIPALEKLNVMAAIVGGSLTPDDDPNGKVGEEIIAAIKHTYPHMPVLGWAKVDRLPGADMMLSKFGAGLSLQDAVEKLLTNVT